MDGNNTKRTINWLAVAQAAVAAVGLVVSVSRPPHQHQRLRSPPPMCSVVVGSVVAAPARTLGDVVASTVMAFVRVRLVLFRCFRYTSSYDAPSVCMLPLRPSSRAHAQLSDEQCASTVFQPDSEPTTCTSSYTTCESRSSYCLRYGNQQTVSPRSDRLMWVRPRGLFAQHLVT